MDLMQFTQALSRIWVLETRLLDKAKIQRMIEAPNADDVIKILGETEYANVMGNVKRASDYEEMLSAELQRVYSLVYELCPVKDIVNLFSTKYIYHNVKVLLKGKFLGKDFSNLLIHLGKDDVNEIKRKIDSDSFGDLRGNIGKAVMAAVEDFEATKDPQRIDIIVDKFMFEELVQIRKSLNYSFTDKIINAMIDSTNIKTLLRIKKQGKGREFAQVIVPGGYIDKDTLVSIINESPENIISKLSFSVYSEIVREGLEGYIATNSANLLEKLSDNYIMALMKDSKFVTFGPERILSYIYAKETEIKLIRIIMVGKLNNVAEEVIRERLRDRKIGVVGDKDSVLAFKALGVDVAPVVGADEARRAVDKMAMNDYAVIFVTEHVAVTIEETIERYNNQLLPAVILIPSNQGTLNIGSKRISESVEKAVGMNIL